MQGPNDPTSVINILLRRKLVSQEQADDALKYQIENHRFIGQVLLERGYITGDNLRSVLREQLELRRERYARKDRVAAALKSFELSQDKVLDAARSLANDAKALSEKIAPIRRTPEE